MRISYRRSTLTVLVMSATLVACNEALVPDFNTLTGFPHSVSALQNEISGALNGLRSDVGAFDLSTDAFARSAAYYTPSEPRFVTEWTGENALDDDNFGAAMRARMFTARKTADTIIAILPTLTSNGAPVPTASVKA